MSAQGPTTPRSGTIKRSPTTTFSTTSPRLTNELEQISEGHIKFILHKIKKVPFSKAGTLIHFQSESKDNGAAPSSMLDFELPHDAPNTNNYNLVVIYAAATKEKVRIPFLILETQMLGQGAEGKVVKAINLKTRDIVACKISKHYGLSSEYQQVERERRNLQMLDGRFFGQYTAPKMGDEIFEYTFMKYYPGVTLTKHLYNIMELSTKVYVRRELPLLHLEKICFAILHEVLFIHDRGLVFRDLKPDNFMIYKGDHPDDFKLTCIDLGSAKNFHEASICLSLDGTSPGYVDPNFAVDLEDRPSFSEKSDYFSLAILLAEILSQNNFQANLKKKLCEIEVNEGCLRVLSAKEKFAFFPEIFETYKDIQDLSFVGFYKQLDEKSPAKDNLKQTLIYLIFQLSKPLDKRINTTQLKEILDSIKVLLFKATVESSTPSSQSDSREKFRKWKRNRGRSQTAFEETSSGFSRNVSERSLNKKTDTAKNKLSDSTSSFNKKDRSTHCDTVRKEAPYLPQLKLELAKLSIADDSVEPKQRRLTEPSKVTKQSKHSK